jgi:hypothetical protein
MKLARWKVVGLAGVLALGYVAFADAAQVKVDDNTWADFGLNMKVSYKHLDKRSNGTDFFTYDWMPGGSSQNVFDVDQAQIYFMGQVLPSFQFYAEFNSNNRIVFLNEAGINLAFAKEFQVLAGLIRKPFTRAQLVSGYAQLTPQPFWLDPQYVLEPIRIALRNADGGLMIHGDLAGGMFRYRVGVYNEDRSRKLWAGSLLDSFNPFWWWRGWFWGYSSLYYSPNDYVIFETKQTPGTKANDFKNFEWDVRIEFTPTKFDLKFPLLKFKPTIKFGEFEPEPAATITSEVADTYLGSKDIFTIGFGFHTETHTPKLTAVILGKKAGVPFTETHNLDELKRKGWTIDAMYEKKFWNFVPNFQTGYVSLKETHYYIDYTDLINGGPLNFKKGDTNIWYATGQLLFDKPIWLGKPAIAFRYEKIKGDGQWTNKKILETLLGRDSTPAILKKDLTIETLGGAFNYYIKGQAARISVGLNQTKYKDALKYFLKTPIGGVKRKDSITDWYLYFQFQF